MMRAEKGITLVALVITIIVMLILVAVSVTFAVQSGLFTQADQATKDWSAKEQDEANAKAQVMVNGQKVDIEEYVSGL